MYTVEWWQDGKMKNFFETKRHNEVKRKENGDYGFGVMFLGKGESGMKKEWWQKG